MVEEELGREEEPILVQEESYMYERDEVHRSRETVPRVIPHTKRSTFLIYRLVENWWSSGERLSRANESICLRGESNHTCCR